MAAFTLTKHTNIRDLTVAGGYAARVSSDTIDTAGFNFTQDQDNRYGLGANTSAVWGSLTINATKGGQLNFDGRYIRMIPFTLGSGTITAGATVTCGSATGVVIGIYASLTTAPVLTGTLASGWIKVTAWNSVAFPTSGVFTQAGYTFTIGGADIVGFIEVDGVEAATITANRLGSVNITGEWYEVGTTNGISNQTMQIPNNGLTCWHPGVFIETTASSGVFEFYPNNGVNTTTGTEATRGKVVWIANTGLVRIGNSGAATNGYTPVTGLRVRIGNVFFNNVVTTLTANVIPNTTVATRYDFTTTGGGVINIDKCSMGWYLSCSQAYSVNVSNSCFSDAILLSETATPMTFISVGVGNKPTTALATTALTLQYCYAGGTFTDCVWQKNSGAAAGKAIAITDIAGFTFIREKVQSMVIMGNVGALSHSITRAKNCTWTTPTIITGGMALITCDTCIVTDLIWCTGPSGTTVTTYATYIFTLSLNTLDCIFSGLTLPVTDTHPYAGILSAATGCSGIKLRNIGTRAVPLDIAHATAANSMGIIYTVATNCSNFKIQRVYVSGTRTGIMTGDNSSSNIIEENVWGDYADAVDVMAILGHQRKGMGGTGALTAQTSVYGTHWRDGFTSTTAGRIAILMNETTVATTSQVTLANGSAFTSAGGLYMPVIGHTITFEMPVYMLGHTAFTNTALAMGGGTATKYTYEYAIDKNDGNGWSTMTSASYTATTLGTALSGITGINAQLGFKLRLKITTGTTNTTAITSVYITTVSTTTAQDYQYPLDVGTITVIGMVSGSRMKASKVSDNTVLFNGAESGGVASFSTDYIGAINIEVRKATATPYYIPWVTQVTSVANTVVSAVALQQLDE